jgi:hypothetical protein
VPGLPGSYWRTTAVTLALILAAAGAVLGAVHLMQRGSQDRGDRREAEIKAGLHAIQLAVQQYEADYGCYPPWLIGGEARFAAQVDTANDARAFLDIRECANPDAVSDPLLRSGYLTAYPRNPFTRSGVSIHQVQDNLPSAAGRQDPLRNGCETGEKYGTRFGADCTLMGSVLADPRYCSWAPLGQRGEQLELERTYCDVEYEFWDVWVGHVPDPYLPGQFFYKSAGPVALASPKSSEFEPVLPVQITEYLLGGYGGPRTMGGDVLGEERRIVLPASSRTRGGDDWLAMAGLPTDTLAGKAPAADLDGAQLTPAESTAGEHAGFWPWTRSEISPDPAARAGSPYGLPRLGAPRENFPAGNGIGDAIIFMLYSD